MDTFIFSGPAQIQIQNGEQLSLLDRQLYFAAYELRGFAEEVMLLDYRAAGQEAADQFLRHHDRKALAARLNQPARVEIWQLGPQQLLVELDETAVTDTNTVLWMGATRTGKIPATAATIFCQEKPVSARKTAALALYEV
ncbi:MAG: hypothetical protein KC413_21090 [Anaerolineales bacterium]|nr:hypothetical protein [Anaerolineales bacterium]MCA9978275.1 hypothetical protein [Anaerolineales bacterium]